jgi:hypothetical protein
VLYKNVDKSKWGRGEWDTEPDFSSWIDNETGYLLEIHRYHGALNGYVTIPTALEIDQYAAFGYHYTITFNNVDKPNNHRRLGFDCGHGGDYNPSYSAIPEMEGLSFGLTYRNFEYVKQCVERMAKSLKKMELNGWKPVEDND